MGVVTSKPDCLSKEQVRNEIREIIGLLTKGGVIFVCAVWLEGRQVKRYA